VFDKFRDTISARDICRVITSKIHERMGPDVVVNEMPISDGGDGFVECMSHAFKNNPFVTLHEIEVLDPLKRPTTA
jgi:glycerate kinase